MRYIILMLIVMLTLTSCGVEPCSTDICYENQLQNKKLEQEQVARDRAYKLETLRIQAEIEAAKPVAVKVAEIENDGMSLGEGVATAATVVTIGGVVWELMK